jgi:hypothetical protein
MSSEDKIIYSACGDPTSAVEKSRNFIHSFVADALSLEEVKEHLTRYGRGFPQVLEKNLKDLEAVLSSELPWGTLLELVILDANIGLDDPSEESARVWLENLADLVRSVIRELKA